MGSDAQRRRLTTNANLAAGHQEMLVSEDHAVPNEPRRETSRSRRGRSDTHVDAVAGMRQDQRGPDATGATLLCGAFVSQILIGRLRSVTNQYQSGTSLNPMAQPSAGRRVGCEGITDDRSA